MSALAAVEMQRTLSLAIQVIGLLLLLAILAGVVVMLFAVASLVNVPGQVGGQLGDVAGQASRAVGSAGQTIQRIADPNPPPLGLVHDTEFSSLHVWRINDRLPDGTDYVLSVREIRRRDGAESADAALLAVVHAELRQPRETRVFGQVVRTDADPHDHVIYKGETFRIGRALYRVNWISQQEAAVAAGTLRNPDRASAPLRFEYD
jgi:hypothetical protein